MVSKLLKYIPLHKYYLEVFGGGASLLFAKEPSTLEVYNDIDSNLVNLFRVIRDKDKFKKFYNLVSLTPYSREEYYYCVKNLDNCIDEIDCAYKYFISIRMCFSGTIGSGWKYSIKSVSRNISKNVSAYLSIIDLLPEIHARIMTTQIEHLDWKKCVEKYNEWGKDGFFYLDPPYFKSAKRSGGYKYEFTEEEHKQLIEWLLNKCSVNVMLSGYDNSIYRKLEDNGWKKICWKVGCDAVGRTRHLKTTGSGSILKQKHIRQECIWINY